MSNGADQTLFLWTLNDIQSAKGRLVLRRWDAMKLMHNRLEVAAAILYIAAAIVMFSVSVVAGLPVFFAAVACTAQSRVRFRRSSAAAPDDAA
jgi:hypothetical protein